MSASDLPQTDPAYHAGFYDAQDGEPLFDDADPTYAKGWRAFWKVREILATWAERATP